MSELKSKLKCGHEIEYNKEYDVLEIESMFTDYVEVNKEDLDKMIAMFQNKPATDIEKAVELVDKQISIMNRTEWMSEASRNVFINDLNKIKSLLTEGG